MKNYKNLSIIKTLGLLSILSFNLSIVSKNQSDLSEFNDLNKYEYKINTETKPAAGDSINGNRKVLSDIIISDTFSTGKTRIKTTESTNDHTTTVTTETWKTKNPSYWTWQNGALVLTSAAALGIGSWAATKGFNFYPTQTSTSHINSMADTQDNNTVQNQITSEENWEAGVYDGDHAILNTQGLSADAPWSEKLAITAGGTVLGYTPAAIGAAQAYVASVGALGAEGVVTGLQKFGSQTTNSKIVPTATQISKPNFNTYLETQKQAQDLLKLAPKNITPEKQLFLPVPKKQTLDAAKNNLIKLKEEQANLRNKLNQTPGNTTERKALRVEVQDYQKLIRAANAALKEASKNV